MGHFICTLLAIGITGIGTIPHFLADFTSIPDFGYCSRWGIRFIKIHTNPAGTLAQKNLRQMWTPAYSLFIQLGKYEGFV